MILDWGAPPAAALSKILRRNTSRVLRDLRVYKYTSAPILIITRAWRRSRFIRLSVVLVLLPSRDWIPNDIFLGTDFDRPTTSVKKLKKQMPHARTNGYPYYVSGLAASRVWSLLNAPSAQPSHNICRDGRSKIAATVMLVVNYRSNLSTPTRAILLLFSLHTFVYETRLLL